MCSIYCSALLPLLSSQSSYDEVMCHLTLPPSVFPCCQNSDRRMKCGQELIFSSAVRKPTALCANHNRKSPPSSPLVQQSGTRFSVKERKTTWSEKVWAYAERHHGGTTIHSSNKPHSNILPKPIRERVNSVHKSLRENHTTTTFIQERLQCSLFKSTNVESQFHWRKTLPHFLKRTITQV